MNKQSFIITVLVLIALSIYLFVEAPPPLDASAQKGRMVPVETLFRVVAEEQAAARALYTQEIVGPGTKAGLKFDENWRSPQVQAGPLPALFLRETALNLEKYNVRLGLFLGSDFPIAAANKFTGKQNEAFQKIRENRQAQFFYAEDTKLYTAMFPDLAAAPACVSCHNEHAQSPKKDWLLNDVMGATTWSYNQKEVSLDEVIKIVATLRLALRESYEAFLTKTKSYSSPPEIGTKWPRDGYFLPDANTFLQEAAKRSSFKSMDLIIKANQEKGK
jgi:adenylate cyclase